MNFPKGIEVITGAIIRNKAGKLLVVQSPKWNLAWGIPGGHLEPGERIFECAEREVKEETGLDAKAVALLKVAELINLPEFHRRAHMISMIVRLDVTGGEVNLDGNEMVDYRWVTPDEALSMTETTVREAFQAYVENEA